MHDFKYKRNELYCEDARILDLAKKFGTPIYIYSYKTIVDHYLKLKTAFRDIAPLICYSVKANSNLAILKILVDKGAGLDIVSGGELFRAMKVGCLPERIVYASVGKTDKEIEKAIKIGILFFNVESIPELENINRIARSHGKIARVCIRINPDVEPRTHRFITTGRLTNKFGIDFKGAYRILLLRDNFSHIRLSGLHIHIGSQITESGPFVSAISKISRFITQLKKENIDLEYLNIGGGLGIIYNKEKPQTAREFARKILPILKNAELKIILEPGRFIVGNAGVLVTKVLYLKKTPLKNFVIVDAGMNDLIRPALYGAHHDILPIRCPLNAKRYKLDVVGPICESGDFFAKDTLMPRVIAGDYLAVMGGGAYGFTMASNYNSRPRPCEVMVKGDRYYPVRKRETYADLVRGESISMGVI